MIRKAQMNDLEGIMAIVAGVKEEMRAEGRAQWGDSYPLSGDFAADIAAQTLYIHETAGRIGGFVCVNAIEPEEYRDVLWSRNEKALVIHRMAVDGHFRKQGIGLQLMKHAEERALLAGIGYLKSDTYSLNPQMNALFKKLNYRFQGEIHFPGREKAFYCYEKVLAQT